MLVGAGSRGGTAGAVGLVCAAAGNPSQCQLPDQAGHGAGNIVGAISDANPNAGFAVAENFVLQINGIVNIVCWWGGYVDFSVPGDCGPGAVPDHFTITYFNNDPGCPDGAPGTTLAGPFPVIAIKAATGNIIPSAFGNLTEFEYTATHPAVNFPAGQCSWIQIQNNTAPSTCLWFWSTAPPGDGDSHVFNDADPDKDFDLAFCVNKPLGNIGASCTLPINPACVGATGPCGSPHPTPGCEDPCCCTEVCKQLPLCCLNAWSQSCAETALSACTLSCCGDPGAGTCCQPDNTPCCDDADCCNAVCDIDPFCCNTSWDPTCANEAADLCGPLCMPVCGDPAAGSCFAAHPTPSCDDAACCETVCSIEPSCCDAIWDEQCVSFANVACGPPGHVTVALAQEQPTGYARRGGDPVDLFTGSFVTEVTHLRIPGRGLDFEWTLTYDGNIVYVGQWELGSAWSSPYLQRLLLTGPPQCPWDLDENGSVDVVDFLGLLAAWGTDPGGPPDFDGSGSVGIVDFLALLANWGPCPTSPAGQDICFVDGRGRVDQFGYVDGVVWSPPPHVYRDLRHDGAAQEFIMTADGDTEYFFFDFSAILGRQQGRLKRIEDRVGNAITFEYAGGLLTRILDTYNRPITFAYECQTAAFDDCEPTEECGRVRPCTTMGATHCFITGVTDFTGREISLEYYAPGDMGGTAGQMATVRAPEVVGTSTGNDFAGPTRKTTIYTYDSTQRSLQLKNNLLTVTDPKGQTYLTTTYAATADENDPLFNRVVAQQYGPGTYHFHYEEINEPFGPETASLLCIVNDRRGVVREVRMNARGNPVSDRVYTGFADPDFPTTPTTNRPTNPLRPGDPAFFETLATFDGDGKPLVVTNPRGNFNSRTYNGSATERHGEDNPTVVVANVGPVGGPVPELTSVWSYESNHQLPKTLTDPRGHTATLYYDYEEAALGDLNGDGITTDDRGLLVRVDYPPVTLGLAASGGSQQIAETFRYNSFGQHTHDLDGEGHVIAYEYYPENDPDGDGLEFIPGGDPMTGGYLRRVILDPGGLNLTTSYTYDPVGNLTSVTNARGHTTTYEINQINQVVRISSPAMNLFPDDSGAVYEQAFIYDANDNVTEIWTEHDNSLNDEIANTPGFSQSAFFEKRMAYDLLDNVVSETVEVGNHPAFLDQSLETQYEYDPSDNPSLIRHPNGDEDAIVYDERELVFRTILGDADAVVPKSIRQFDYDLNGNLAKRTNPNPANVVNLAYDGFDRVVSQEIVGSSTLVTVQYDDNSNMVDVQAVGPWDAGQPAVSLAHLEARLDELDRPYEVIEHLFRQEDGSGLQGGALTQGVWQHEYNKDNLLVRTINPRGHETALTYDSADRALTATDAVGNHRLAVYGDNLNVTQVVTTEVNSAGPPDVFTLLFEFDELNRLRRTEDDLNNVTSLRRDSRGLTSVRTDAEGNEWKSQFDGLGRRYSDQRQVSDGQFIALSRTWDGRSRLVQSVDGLGRATQFSFDSHNRLILRTNADLTTRAYTWDVEDNLAELIRENGERLVIVYDDVNRLIERRYHEPSMAIPTITDHFDYSALYAPTRVLQVGGHTVSYKRESRNLPLECTQTIAGNPARTVALDYNAVGNPTHMAYPGGRVVQLLNYTGIERVGDITSGATNIHYDYSGYGRVKTRSASNGFQTVNGFDAIKRLVSSMHSIGGTTLVGFTEQYDKVHNLRAETFLDTESGTEHARVYHLDRYYRVKGFIRHLDPALVPQAIGDFSTIVPGDGDSHEVIQYDDANNMTSVVLDGVAHAVVNSSMNETEGFGGLRTNIQYDDNGRLTSYVQGGSIYSFTWNLRDQLIRVERDGVGVAEYDYYPDGMRARKILPSGEEHFYGMRMSVHEVYDSGTALVKEFVHEGLDRPLVMFADADNNPGTGENGREAYFYHANPRGDVYALSDESGGIVERYDYTLFGTPGILDASYTDIGSSLLGNPFMFGGAYLDAESGLYHMRFRYYDPFLRKFLSRDPAEDDSLDNLYAAFENHPGRYIDPLGLRTKESAAGVPFAAVWMGSGPSVLLASATMLGRPLVDISLPGLPRPRAMLWDPFESWDRQLAAPLGFPALQDLDGLWEWLKELLGMPKDWKEWLKALSKMIDEWIEKIKDEKKKQEAEGVKEKLDELQKIIEKFLELKEKVQAAIDAAAKETPPELMLLEQLSILLGLVEDLVPDEGIGKIIGPFLKAYIKAVEAAATSIIKIPLTQLENFLKSQGSLGSEEETMAAAKAYLKQIGQSEEEVDRAMKKLELKKRLEKLKKKKPE